MNYNNDPAKQKVDLLKLRQYITDIINPCVWCYQRYDKQYTPDCGDKCQFAKAVKENKLLKEKIMMTKGLFMEVLNIADDILENDEYNEFIDKFDKVIYGDE